MGWIGKGYKEMGKGKEMEYLDVINKKVK